MAARIQGLTAPDTLVISAVTFQLVQGYFTVEDLGAAHLRGVAAPVHVNRILGESGAQSRLDAVGPTHLTPLVGRAEEVALMHQRWEQAKTGLGQVVVLSGEAGIGKSRLVQVLKDHVATEPHARIEWRGSPYHQQSALYPVIDHLHRLLRWPPLAWCCRRPCPYSRRCCPSPCRRPTRPSPCRRNGSASTRWTPSW